MFIYIFVYAYVYVSDISRMWFCTRFWSLTVTPTGARAVAIIFAMEGFSATKRAVSGSDPPGTPKGPPMTPREHPRIPPRVPGALMGLKYISGGDLHQIQHHPPLIYKSVYMCIYV